MANGCRSPIWPVFVRLIYGLHERRGEPVPTDKSARVKGRLAPFFGSCAPAARRRKGLSGGAARSHRDGAQPRHHTNWKSLDPGGTGFRGGRMRRRRVRSNLPLGLLNAQGYPRPQANFCESPDGWGARRGMSPLVAIHSGGMVSRERDRRKVITTLSRVPGFFVCRSFRKESSKTALGCLTYSRIWYLSRNKHNLL